MDFGLPSDLVGYVKKLDEFIDREVRPIEEEDDNIRFFDHRREYARTDFERGGLPRHEWEELLGRVKRKADEAGHLRFGLPSEFAGSDGSYLEMAVIREHLAAKGLGLHQTAWQMDQMDQNDVATYLSDNVSMRNFFGNRLVCDAADRAMQVHGGLGYSGHKPFEHIYRDHRRYRITAGTEEIQMRKVAGYLFGHMGPRKKEVREMDFSRQGGREY